MSLVQVIIDDSTNKIVTGLFDFDRVNGGTLKVPSGTAFPGTPVGGEVFWRTDLDTLYRRDDANTTWEAVSAAVALHAPTHASGGTDELLHQALNGAGSNTHAQIDTHIANGVQTQLQWGNGSISATTTTRFLTPCWDSSIAPTSAIEFDVTAAGTLQQLRVRQVGAGNGNNVVFTVMVNGVATALTCTLASTGTSANDATNNVAVAVGDRVSIRVTKAAGIGSSPSNVIATLRVKQ